jgi:hypothetical protein
MSYDRSKAMEYAKANWTKPCEDGLVGLEEEHARLANLRVQNHAPDKDWDALFLRDPGKGNSERGIFRKKGAPLQPDKPFATFHDLDDCAHYLSQCFIKGGASIDNQFGVQGLINSLQNLPNTKTLIEKCSANSAERLVKLKILQPGDLIAYFNTSAKSFGYTHSTMYVGDGGITCHTFCRFKGQLGSEDDDWDLGRSDGFTYTFVHFSAGDMINPVAAKSLTGWWSVQYGVAKSFLFVFSDGRALRSAVAPQNATSMPRGGEPAYWFQNASSVRFSWRSTGDLEEWTLDGRNAVVKSKLCSAAMIPGNPSKVF